MGVPFSLQGLEALEALACAQENAARRMRTKFRFEVGESPTYDREAYSLMLRTEFIAKEAWTQCAAYAAQYAEYCRDQAAHAAERSKRPVAE